MNKNYKLAFKLAAAVVPIIMGVVGAYFGNVQPVVRDVCALLLPVGTSIQVPSQADAGAPR